MYGEHPEHLFKAVLIGGGAALLKHLYALQNPSSSKKKSLPELSPNLSVFDDSPDFQTALIIHQ